MSDELSPLDLKFLPDWLKEAPSTNKYAQFTGESSDRPRRNDGFRGGSGGNRGPQGGPGGGRDRDSRSGPRGEPQRGRGRDGDAGKPFGDRRGGGPRRGGDHPRSGQGRPPRDSRGPSAEPQLPPPGFKLEFLPDPTAAAHIAKQIRQSSRAYPLYGTARMFLEKPERHQVRVISTDPNRPLYQLEDGPVTFDRSLLERSAFRLLKDRFYREESREIEAPKGNYTSVARCRSTGTLLGPTNHHAYQVAIRKLYEERFSRRMSFIQFQKEEIEILANEQAVADWKSQASKVTAYFTTTEPEPVEFKSLQEAEAHFQKQYLPNLIRSATNLVCSGRAAREFPDRFLSNAAREAFSKELAYPNAIVHGLRHQFADHNLHVFKHRKRVLYVSAIRPTPATTSYEFAEGPATLLTLIREHPRISKRDLAAKILGIETPSAKKAAPVEAAPVEATPVEAAPVEAAPVEAAPVEAAPVEAAPVEAASVDASAAAKAPATDPLESDELLARKKQLAADLHYLVYAGHVIEFADGKLDLPIVPLPASQGKGKPTGNDTSAHEDESGSSLDPEDHNVEEFNEPQTSTDPQQTDEAIESEDHGQTSIEASSPGAPSES